MVRISVKPIYNAVCICSLKYSFALHCSTYASIVLLLPNQYFRPSRRLLCESDAGNSVWMLRSHCGKPAIESPVTIMTTDTDLKYLTQEQIDRVRESVGLMLYITEYLLSYCWQFHRDG